MITFVTFHVDPQQASLSPETPYDLAKRANYSAEYREMLSLMFQSVSFFHLDARKVILTDRHTQFDNLPEDIEIYRYEMAANDVMLSRTKAQVAFIETHDFASNVMFLDSDILINDSLEAALNWAEFDIALTIREDPLGMPINGGALFVSSRRPQVAIAFLQSFYQTYIEHYLNESQWWGDQKALADLLNDKADPVVLGSRSVGEALVQLVSCDVYNYSPDFKSAIDVYGAGVGRKVVHFKGDRKQFMRSFWEQCICTRLLQPEVQFNAFQHQLDSLQKDRARLQAALDTEQKARHRLKKGYRDLQAKTRVLSEKNTALKQHYQDLLEHPFRLGYKALKDKYKRKTT